MVTRIVEYDSKYQPFCCSPEFATKRLPHDQCRTEYKRALQVMYHGALFGRGTPSPLTKVHELHELDGDQKRFTYILLGRAVGLGNQQVNIYNHSYIKEGCVGGQAHEYISKR